MFSVLFVQLHFLKYLNTILLCFSDEKNPDGPEEVYTCVQIQPVSHPVASQVHDKPPTVPFGTTVQNDCYYSSWIVL